MSLMLEERIRQLAYRLYERERPRGRTRARRLAASRTRGSRRRSRSGKTEAERHSNDATPIVEMQGNRLGHSV